MTNRMMTYAIRLKGGGNREGDGENSMVRAPSSRRHPR